MLHPTRDLSDVTTREGHVSGITFSVTGHPDLVNSVVGYIKSLGGFTKHLYGKQPSTTRYKTDRENL